MDEMMGRHVLFRCHRVGSIAAKDSFGPESGSIVWEQRSACCGDSQSNADFFSSFLLFFNNKTCPLLPSPLLKRHQSLKPYFPISQPSEKSLIEFNSLLSHDKALLCSRAAPRWRRSFKTLDSYEC